MIDLAGRLAVPGFIDNHTHFIDGGFRLASVQLRDAASPEEFARRIEAHARAIGAGAWVTGGGWDEQSWTPCTLPDRNLIDIANPVFVTRLDMHMGVANAAALKLAGITRDTPDPAGGTIVRDSRGEPTGLLKDAAMRAMYAAIPPRTIEQRVAAARVALREAVRFGVTSLCDMSWSDAFDDLRAYQQLERQGELTAHVYLFTPLDAYGRLADAGIEKCFGGAGLRIGGLKGFADGSLGSSTAAFFEPFEGEPHNRGLEMQALSDGSMARWVADADAHNLQIAIHAIGDRANDAVLAIFESRPDVRARRFRIEHAQHLDRDLVQRFAKSGVIASMQPYHAVDDGRWADAKIGRERAKFAYAFRSLLDAGAIVTFGSDWSVAPLNPLLGIHAAVTRRIADGSTWIPEQRITVEEALRCYTINNAYAMFAEHELGRVAPGYRADIAVLSHDLFTIAPEEIGEVEVDLTISDGQVVYQRQH